MQNLNSWMYMSLCNLSRMSDCYQEFVANIVCPWLNNQEPLDMEIIRVMHAIVEKWWNESIEPDRLSDICGILATVIEKEPARA